MNKKYLLLASQNSTLNKKELEAQALPYTFTSNGHRVRNYRIYGAEDGVGDLDSTTGKYIIPVTLEWNLFDEMYLSNTRQSMCSLSMSNHVITVSAMGADCYFGTVLISNGSTYNENMGQKIPCFAGAVYSVLLDGDIFNKNYVTFIDESNYSVSHIKFTTNPYTFTVPTNAKYMLFRIGYGESVAGETYNLTVTVVRGTTFPTVFEPYHKPCNVSIQLDEPLCEDEYIDFREQKRFNSDGTSEIVLMPALSVDGTNTIISVGTIVQPSKLYIQGNISEIETVSAETQALQTNIQSLQPLSLDENSIEEILETENLETTGDDENAE